MTTVDGAVTNPMMAVQGFSGPVCNITCPMMTAEADLTVEAPAVINSNISIPMITVGGLF